MGVVERVVDHPSVPAVAHDPRGAQQSQRVRHGRLGYADGLGKVAHAQLSRLEERVQQPGARGIAQELELVRQPTGLLGGDEALAHRRHALGIDEPARTGIKSDDVRTFVRRHLHRCSDISDSVPRCQALAIAEQQNHGARWSRGGVRALASTAMVASRSWSLLLVPGGLVAGHGAVGALGSLVGAPPFTGWDGSVLGALLCLSVPLSLAVFTRALVAGLPTETVPSLFRLLAPVQASLFLAIELYERGGQAASSGAAWVLVGVVAQIGVAAVSCALVRALDAAGARLRQRRHVMSARATSRHAIVVSCVRLGSVLGLESLSRRGPPLLATP